jgi:GTP cyclohydrolase I
LSDDPLATAVAAQLTALALPPNAELDGTPMRVAQLWRETLLSGYAADPAQILAAHIPDEAGALVVITDIPFHCVCPHHLLPAIGHAHVAFDPNGAVVGFGQIEALVQAFARRLVLQETLTAQIADALMTHLGAHGAACALTAQHLCLSLRGREPRSARVHTRVERGSLVGCSGLPVVGSGPERR